MITKTGRHADIDMDCHAPRVMMKYTSVGPQWTRECSIIKASLFVPEHIFHHLSTCSCLCSDLLLLVFHTKMIIFINA